jgi:alpha-galactosidase
MCVIFGCTFMTNGAHHFLAWDCHAGPNQQYEFSGLTIYALGGQRCLDVYFGGTAPGTKVESYPCNGAGAQRWYYYNGLIVNTNSGLCLDAGSGANGTQLIINNCSSTAPGQQWQIK